MSWWLWVLIWLALAVATVVFFFLLLRSLWRKLRQLFAELSTASERLAEVTRELERLEESRHREPEEAAVFTDPGRLRAQRFADRTKRGRSARRTRT